MQDIADAVGVHRTTVSMALRGHPSIPVKTRDRIRDMAERMGYVPDPALSALVSYRQSAGKNRERHNQVIAFVVDFKETEQFGNSHVHPLLARGARERASALGYGFELFWYGRDYKSSTALNRVLQTRAIRGIILGAFGEKAAPIDLDWDRYSVVKINLLPNEHDFDAILSNQLFVIQEAVKVLVEMGLRRIGMASAEKDGYENRNLYTAGWRVAQRNYRGIRPSSPYYFKTKDTEVLRAEIRDWAVENKLEAILTNWNIFDLSAWEAGQKLGHPCRFVPLDANPRVLRDYGGADQNHVEIGRRAIDMVVAQIQGFRFGLPETPSMTLVEPTWHALKPCTLDMERPRDDTNFTDLSGGLVKLPTVAR